jgi:hypothetical protein
MIRGMDTRTKVRENLLRRMADRQRLQLQKSRRRDPNALDYGTYWLTDPGNSNALVFPAGEMSAQIGAELDEIGTFLRHEYPWQQKPATAARS